MKYIIAAIVLILGGCATPVSRYSVIQELEPYSFYYKGTPHLGSGGKNARIYLGPASAAQSAGERHLFLVEIKNLGDRPFNVTPEDFEVTTDAGKVLPVLSAEVLQKEAKRKANRLKFAASLETLSNNLAAADAGYSHSYGSYSSTGAIGPLRTSTHGNFSATHYNGAAAAHARIAANAENRRLWSEYDAMIGDILANAQRSAFPRQTVYPGKSVIAPVLITKIPKDTQQLTVALTVADERHSFQWLHSIE